MIDLKQANEYFFSTLEKGSYTAEFTSYTKENIDLKTNEGVEFRLSVSRNTTKYDYFNLYINADKYYAINVFKIIFTPNSLTSLGTVKQPGKLWNKKYDEQKRQVDLLQKLVDELQFSKTEDLRAKIEHVSNVLSNSMKDISKNPTVEKVQDFREKLAEMNSFIEQYEKK